VVRFWATDSGEKVQQLEATGMVETTAWSPDGRLLASGDDRTIRIWDLASAQLRRTMVLPSGRVGTAAWSPDGTSLVTSRGGPVLLWDINSDDSPKMLTSDGANAVSWSADGRTVAGAFGDHTVRLWDVGSQGMLRSLQGHTAGVRTVAWSPDGNLIASASDDNTVRVWLADSGQLMHSLPATTQERVLAWSPDGKLLAYSSSNTAIQLWNAVSGQLVGELRNWEDDRALALRWLPDGRTLTAAATSRVWSWDTENGKLVKYIYTHMAGSGATLSHDGSLVALNSHYGVRLLEAATGRPRGSLVHLADSQGLILSPDGHYRAADSDSSGSSAGSRSVSAMRAFTPFTNALMMDSPRGW